MSLLTWYLLNLYISRFVQIASIAPGIVGKVCSISRRRKKWLSRIMNVSCRRWVWGESNFREKQLLKDTLSSSFLLGCFSNNPPAFEICCKFNFPNISHVFADLSIALVQLIQYGIQILGKQCCHSKWPKAPGSDKLKNSLILNWLQLLLGWDFFLKLKELNEHCIPPYTIM